MMYPAGPGSGDSPEGFPEQPRLQPQIGNCTAQTLGTEIGSMYSPSLSWLGQKTEVAEWGRETHRGLWVA